MSTKVKAAGLAPGTLIHVGEHLVSEIRIRITDYTPKEVLEVEVTTPEECRPFKEKDSVTWINVDGLHEVEVVRRIGELFGLHPLLLEDILNTGHRPKIEDFEDWVLIMLKMLSLDENTGDTRTEHVSLVIGPGWVLSFQEREGDVFDPVRERIRVGKGRLRTMEEDYLAYALIDTIVDNYFVILESLSERIEKVEEELMVAPRTETLQTIYQLKKEVILLRKSVWPVREVVNSLLRGESRLVKERTLVFLRDLYDHTIQIIDTVETFRDLVSGLLDIYLSSISNRMNEVMKTLTVMATIFIPLTFIAGIYGMNFDYMPELQYRYGYPLVWVVMSSVAGGMLLYFRKQKWF